MVGGEPAPRSCPQPQLSLFQPPVQEQPPPPAAQQARRGHSLMDTAHLIQGEKSPQIPMLCPHPISSPLPCQKGGTQLPRPRWDTAERPESSQDTPGWGRDGSTAGLTSHPEKCPGQEEGAGGGSHSHGKHRALFSVIQDETTGK